MKIYTNKELITMKEAEEQRISTSQSMYEHLSVSTAEKMIKQMLELKKMCNDLYYMAEIFNSDQDPVWIEVRDRYNDMFKDEE